MSLFKSRWVQQPDHVTESEGLPKGFRAAGVSAGIKRSGKFDVGLIVSDEQQTTSAAMFTRSGTAAPPVLVTRERCKLGELRAVAVNSGIANAATWRRGLDEAARMQGAGAIAAGVPADQVAVCSTGVIGVHLPGDQIVKGLGDCARALSTDGAADFQAAIMTTDKFEKSAYVEVQLSGGTVKLSAQSKGAGMIQPAHATMLCFVQTDAKMSAETAALLFRVCVKRSFDRITVDGQLSTNDTSILMCSGASGVEVRPDSPDEAAFGSALDAVLRHLALEIVRDGEGSKRVGRVVVHGEDPNAVERSARSVANSPLVKAALHGGDPNWGRINQAVGMAVIDAAPLAVDIAIEGVQVCVAGNAVSYDESALAKLVSGDEVEYVIGLPGNGHESEVFFSDLSHEYVTINAEYTT